MVSAPLNFRQFHDLRVPLNVTTVAKEREGENTKGKAKGIRVNQIT